MYLVRIDKIKNIQYTEVKERFIRWLKLISAQSIQEMEIIGKDDVIMNEAIEFVKKWNNKSPEENLENYVKNREKFAYQDGIEIGSNSKTLEIAINMLKLNIDVKKIAKATGLSSKEILKLKNDVSLKVS